MGIIVKTPEPPYYVVTFTNELSGKDVEKYQQLGIEMFKLAETMPGYLGEESVRNAENQGITLSYWTDRISILNWKKQSDHLQAQQLGKDVFYNAYSVRVAKVEKSYTLEDYIKTKATK
ncbi:uncharacterized protein RJT20DRAFT_40237 [Scheffersomyces xylosifermentans]|uniref:uncharacterized protein n=1 Tax=Scheffersomyces xylosifermentans TaxID=1304137 RepID=UPI00315D91ED